MVTFDSRVAGTPAVAWDDDARLRLAPRLEVDECSELLVFAAHADDETLGAAELISDFARRGLPVHLVVATDGAATGGQAIAKRRSTESAAALAILAPNGRRTELGFGDARTEEQRDELAERIGQVIGEAAPNALLVTTWAGDGHRDHRVVGELVAERAGGRRVIAYPIWMWHWAAPSDADLPWTRFRIFSGADGVGSDVKARALEEYPSQTEGADPMLTPEMLEHFRAGREIFIEVDSDDPPSRRLDAEYFDRLHERREDPWSFLTRWYEQRKRSVTLANLVRERYPTALEVGCSIGVLTAELAPRCDDLLAVDVSAAAVGRARQRVGDRARVEQLDVADGFPAGPYDLIVLSEVGYYFAEDRIDGVLAAARDALADGGELLACHWRHPVADYPLSGDEVHRRIAELGMPRLVRHEEDDFLLEVYSLDARSVATREGLA